MIRHRTRRTLVRLGFRVFPNLRVKQRMLGSNLKRTKEIALGKKLYFSRQLLVTDIIRFRRSNFCIMWTDQTHVFKSGSRKKLKEKTQKLST